MSENKIYPVSLESCPIVEATVQLSCSFNVPKETIMGILYNTINSENKLHLRGIKALPVTNIPEQIRMVDPNLRNKPTHQILCNEGSIMIGSNEIYLGAILPYKSWKDFKEFVDYVLDSTKRSNILKTYSAASIRYLNFFQLNVFDKINLNIKLNDKTINYNSTFVKSEIPSRTFIDIFQISNGVHIENKELNLNTNGSLIDLVIVSKSVSIENVKNMIESLHDEVKKMFFDLLKEEFIKELNPTYHHE